jgi:hypothetical protein
MGVFICFSIYIYIYMYMYVYIYIYTCIHIKESVIDKAMRKNFERKGSALKKKRQGGLDDNSDVNVCYFIYLLIYWIIIGYCIGLFVYFILLDYFII